MSQTRPVAIPARLRLRDLPLPPFPLYFRTQVLPLAFKTLHFLGHAQRHVGITVLGPLMSQDLGIGHDTDCALCPWTHRGHKMDTVTVIRN
jgi:hypothetical protein